MQEFLESETSWLTVTNIVLGVVTFACFIAVARTIFLEVASRVRKRARVRQWQDDHSFVLSDLGVTMADGGEKIDEWEPHPKKNEEGESGPETPGSEK